MPVSRFRFIDLDAAAVLVPVAFFFYALLKKWLLASWIMFLQTLPPDLCVLDKKYYSEGHVLKKKACTDRKLLC